MLDLERPRGAADLVAQTLEQLRRHGGVFMTVTALVVVPCYLPLDGVVARRLADGGNADSPGGVGAAVTFVAPFVINAIVAALHVRIVEMLGRGETPTARGAIAAAVPVVPRAIAGAFAQTACIVVGLVCLIVPGIYMLVMFLVTTPALVAEDLGIRAALRRSERLVRDKWWRVAGTMLLFFLVSAALGGIATRIADYVTLGWASEALFLVGQTTSGSVGALTATLLFFSLRAQERLGLS